MPWSAQEPLNEAVRGNAVELHVLKRCQASSGGDYVVIYDADLNVMKDDPRITVEVMRTDPVEASLADVQLAIEAIRRGAEMVLRPRGEGAIIHVRRLVI